MSEAGLHEIESHVAGTEDVIRQLYEQSLFLSEQRSSFRKDGRPARWALDLRRSLADGATLGPVSKIVAEAVNALGLRQVAGVGAGACFLLGGILAREPGWRAGLVRDARKAYGFCEIVEGALDREQPLAIIDDILSSGITLTRAIRVLREEGFQPAAAIPLFHYSWRDGMRNLSELDIPILPIASLTYSEQPLPHADVIWERSGSWTVHVP